MPRWRGDSVDTQVSSGARSRRNGSAGRTSAWERRRAERAGQLLHETDPEFVAGVQEGRQLDVWDAAAIALGEDENEKFAAAN